MTIMHQVQFDEDLLEKLASQTAIITGAAGGIGAATARVFNENGANVVLADLPAFEGMARKVIASLPHPSKAIFVPANIVHWEQMTEVFKHTIQTFGAVHVVVANAGTMESQDILNVEDVDDQGDLRESNDALRVIDVNLKGTLNSMLDIIGPSHILTLCIDTDYSLSSYSSETGYAFHA
jgi:NAD(P)-dependent dehydrogenase (short-subunit alcohol dehydrogenase family)